MTQKYVQGKKDHIKVQENLVYLDRFYYLK